jgi:hypothetical protein
VMAMGGMLLCVYQSCESGSGIVWCRACSRTMNPGITMYGAARLIEGDEIVRVVHNEW